MANSKLSLVIGGGKVVTQMWSVDDVHQSLGSQSRLVDTHQVLNRYKIFYSVLKQGGRQSRMVESRAKFRTFRLPLCKNQGSDDQDFSGCSWAYELTVVYYVGQKNCTKLLTTCEAAWFTNLVDSVRMYVCLSYDNC